MSRTIGKLCAERETLLRAIEALFPLLDAYTRKPSPAALGELGAAKAGLRSLVNAARGKGDLLALMEAAE